MSSRPVRIWDPGPIAHLSGYFGVHALFFADEVNEDIPVSASGAGASGLASDALSDDAADEMFIDRSHPAEGIATASSPRPDRVRTRQQTRRFVRQTGGMTIRTTEELDAALDHIRDAPADDGELRMIVARPREDAREVQSEGELSLDVGLVGDDWLARGNAHTEDGSAHPLAQLTIMNSRVLEVIAGEEANWPQAGDQLYTDFDLSVQNCPPGTRLAIGSTVVEVTEKPHRGCAKFTRRFGLDAFRWVNSDTGMALKLRGVNARVIEPGPIHTGDRVKKV